jgi:hypothetical protein
MQHLTLWEVGHGVTNKSHLGDIDQRYTICHILLLRVAKVSSQCSMGSSVCGKEHLLHVWALVSCC